jgi:hypothetical protein
MVAYSKHVDKRVKIMSKSYGFDIVLEQPFTKQIFEKEVIEYLEFRKMLCKKEEINNSYEQIQISSLNSSMSNDSQRNGQ